MLGEAVEVPLDGMHGPAPEFTGGQAPHDLAFVVVAVEAERDAEDGVTEFMAGPADRVPAVRTRGGVAPRAAGFGAAVAAASLGAGVLADRADVDGAERRCGEGGEHGWVAAHA